MIRIVGVIQRPNAAVAIGVLLCVATVAVLVVALVLANLDRLNEKRAEQRSDSNTAPAVELTTIVDLSGETSSEQEPEQGIEAGPSHETCMPPTDDAANKDTAVDAESDVKPPSALPLPSILSIGSGILCGEGTTADDTAVPVIITGQASLDELVSLAIAAGATRPEVSRLALAVSKQLSPTATRDDDI